MTQEERKAIDKIYELVGGIRSENDKFREQITGIVTEMNKKVDGKHAPLYFENDILKSCQLAIGECMKNALQGYNSPLIKLIESVVLSRNSELREIIQSSFDQVIRTEDFKASIVSAFSHKVAKSIISNNDGLFDKVANDLKQDAIFKSKMSIAVANVVEECLKK